MTVENNVVHVILNISKLVLGNKGLMVVTNRIKSESPSPSELIFEIADEVQKIFGNKGAHAVMRQIGREVAKSIMSQSPQEKWRELLEHSLASIGFAGRVEKKGEEYCICRCVFYPNFLKPRGIAPTEHSVCWCGIGFIEGFISAFGEGDGICWTRREEEVACFFEVIKTK